MGRKASSGSAVGGAGTALRSLASFKCPTLGGVDVGCSHGSCQEISKSFLLLWGHYSWDVFIMGIFE